MTASQSIAHLKLVDRVSKSGSGAPSVQSTIVKSAPSMPTWLDREGRAEWRRVVPELERLGVIATVDRAVLGLYCDVWSKAAQARLLLRDGLIHEGARGPSDRKKNPAWQIYRDALAECRALWKELALTPVSRHRLDLPEVPNESAAEGLLD